MNQNGGEGAFVVALQESDGAPQWSSPYSAQGSEQRSAPAVDGTGVYVNRGTDGGLYGYERSTGSRRFFQSLDQFDAWTPALHNGGLYSFVKGIFRSHSRSTGAVLWSKTFTWNWLGYDMNRTIACAGDSAFFINDSNPPAPPKLRELICLDLTTQQARWTEGNSAFTGTPALAHGCVYAYASTNTVTAYDTATGMQTAIYTAPTNTYLTGQPLITNDTVIAKSSSQTFLFDLQTRALRQTLPAGGAVSLAGRSLYIASSDGNVRCYQAADPFNPAPSLPAPPSPQMRTRPSRSRWTPPTAGRLPSSSWSLGFPQWASFIKSLPMAKPVWPSRQCPPSPAIHRADWSTNRRRIKMAAASPRSTLKSPMATVCLPLPR